MKTTITWLEPVCPACDEPFNLELIENFIYYEDRNVLVLTRELDCLECGSTFTPTIHLDEFKRE